ncbi:MAG: hypothetical protein JXM70_10995 [Pirellulales bacterium]|nr:hypothetical protein [Pirellulales bacterium]
MKTHHRQRIASEGLLRTVWYFMGTHLLPRISIQLKYLYEYAGDTTKPEVRIPEGVTIGFATAMSDLNFEDIQALQAFEGQELIDRCEQDFSSGCKCAIARKASEGLVGMVWIAPAPPHLVCGNTKTYNLRDAFIVPGMRGKSIYPLLLRETCSHILASESNIRPRIISAGMVSNRSVNRSVAKAGFRRVGIIIIFFRWKLVRLKHAIFHESRSNSKSISKNTEHPDSGKITT